MIKNYLRLLPRYGISYWFDFGTHMIPHPEKAHKGGEDACYANKNMIVVADGVGGWADLGVDPGLYSKELCSNIETLFKEKESHYISNPKELLIQAKQMTKAIGSTTVCVATLQENMLKTALIGDSGYALYRRKEKYFELMFKSKEQQRSFNFPIQIGSEGDDPEVAVTEEHELYVGDLVILGTDGLFDNLSAQQIQQILEGSYKKEEEIVVKELSELLAQYAFELSMDKEYNSPFAQGAKKAKYYYKGGKSDDITIGCAIMRQQDD